MPTGAAIFDLDDTLIVEEEVARSSLRQVAGLLPDQSPERVEEVVLATARQLWRSGPYRQLCWDLGIASWEGLWATFEGGHPILDELREWARSYRPEVWRRALETLGAPGTERADTESADTELAAAMSDKFIQCQRHGHTLIDGAATVVRSWRGTRRLGLLTNGPADIQRLKFEGTGLAECFDAVVISGEVGLGKPDPAVFAYALDRLGATADTTVMVGDNWERDVLGALGAGMSAVWVAAGRPQPEELANVTVVDKIGELSGLIDG